MKSLKSTLLFVVLGMAAVALTGCYTLEGAGRDVGAVGTGVAETADQWRPYE